MSFLCHSSQFVCRDCHFLLSVLKEKLCAFWRGKNCAKKIMVVPVENGGKIWCEWHHCVLVSSTQTSTHTHIPVVPQDELSRDDGRRCTTVHHSLHSRVYAVLSSVLIVFYGRHIPVRVPGGGACAWHMFRLRQYLLFVVRRCYSDTRIPSSDLCSSTHTHGERRERILGFARSSSFIIMAYSY